MLSVFSETFCHLKRPAMGTFNCVEIHNDNVTLNPSTLNPGHFLKTELEALAYQLSLRALGQGHKVSMERTDSKYLGLCGPHV